MTEHPCPVCTAPAPDTAICWDCHKRLVRLLVELGEDLAELTTQLARQGRGAFGSGARSAEKPLPYDVRASEVLDNVRSVLVGWTRESMTHTHAPEHARTGHQGTQPPEVVSESTPPKTGAPATILARPPAWPADSNRALIRHLRRVPWINHPAADELLDELAYTHGEVLACIDNPPPRRYLGPCAAVDSDGNECTGDVYQRGTKTPKCRDCGAMHSADERLEWIQQIAGTHLVTASEAAGALSAWGTHITSDLVRKWAQRGRLTTRGHDQRGRALYAFRDCKALAVESVQRRKGQA